mgnify:CR=1 FL=1
MARSLSEGVVHLTYDSAPTLAEGLETMFQSPWVRAVLGGE